MYTTDRAELREFFFRAWHKYRTDQPLERVEQLIVDVALRHPEYHTALEAPEQQVDRDYFAALGEPNPFMHMSLHIAVAEQLTIDQPPGVRECFQRLRARLLDPHLAEHAMMECLSETLWQAQQSGRPLDQRAYLDCARRRAQEP